MVQFSKLHGNGNDFIIIDEYNEQVISDDKKAEFARKYCERRFGIGADGVLYLLRSKSADLKMRLFQPDCSEAEMCGNGIRCLAKYAMDAGYVSQGTASVETMAGVLQIEMKDLGNEVWVKVNMGRPLFNSKDIPMKGEGDFIDKTLENMQVSVVNTGVPHAVIFVDNLESVDIDRLAPPIRYNPIFTKGTNVNFANFTPDGILNIRTYERGIEGETLSCGTGSVAAAVIAHRLGRTGNKVTINTRGGILNITIENDFAFMEGPAVTVYNGTIA